VANSFTLLVPVSADQISLLVYSVLSEGITIHPSYSFLSEVLAGFSKCLRLLRCRVQKTSRKTVMMKGKCALLIACSVISFHYDKTNR
jgi:NO-binding membrane sensor protein with MHYT domain